MPVRMSIGHSSHPLASCVGGGLHDDIFPTRSHINQRDLVERAVLPAMAVRPINRRVYCPLLRRDDPTPLLGAVKGYVFGSKML